MREENMRMDIDMNIGQIHCFLALADELSFRRAADRLGVSQSSISSQIKRLEMDVGVALFERSTRSVRLTEAGRRVLPEAKALIAQENRFGMIARQQNKMPTDVIFIGDAALALASGIARRLRLPDNVEMMFNLRPRPEPKSSWVAGLIEGYFDILFLNHPPLRKPEIKYELISSCPLVCGVPHASPLNNAPTISADLIVDERVIVPTETLIGPSYRGLIKWLSHAQGQIEYIEVGDDWETILETARLSGALAIVPANIANANKHGMSFRDLDIADLQYVHYVAWRRDEARSHIQEFVLALLDTQMINQAD